MRGYFSPDARGVVDGQHVLSGVAVDRQLAVWASDFRAVFLSCCHHAAAEQLRDFAVVELYNADCVVTVVVFAELRRDSRDADGTHGFDVGVFPEKPECEIDVVDGAVDEDAAGELGVLDEKARGVELVAGLRAEDAGDADVAGGDLGEGVAVGGVEAAREAAHYFLVGVCEEGLLVGSDDSLGEVNACAEWLFTQDVEAALDGFDGLFSVHRRGRSDDHGFEVLLAVEHVVEGKVGADAGEFFSRPLEL